MNEAGGEVLLDERVRRDGSHHQKLFVIRHPDAPDHDVAFVGGIDLCHGRRDDEHHHGDPQAIDLDPRYGPRPAVARRPAGGARPGRRRPGVDVPGALGGPDAARPPQPVAAPPRPHRAGAPPARPAAADAARPAPGRAPRGAGAAHLPGQAAAASASRRRASAASPAPTSRPSAGPPPRVRRGPVPVVRRRGRLPGRPSARPSPTSTSSRSCPATPTATAGCPARPTASASSGPSSSSARPAATGSRSSTSRHRPAGRSTCTPRSCVIDDVWMIVGSDNLNLRSWTNDSELSCAVIDERPRRRASRSIPAVSATAPGCSPARRACGCGASTSAGRPATTPTWSTASRRSRSCGRRRRTWTRGTRRAARAPAARPPPSPPSRSGPLVGALVGGPAAPPARRPRRPTPVAAARRRLLRCRRW